MNLWWLVVAGAGLSSSRRRSSPPRADISAVESRVFHAVNGLPDWLYRPLWLPMQLGNLVVGTAAGLVVALVDGDVTVAIGVVLAMALKLVAERIVRREMADYLAVRQRPGTSQLGAVLRGATCPCRARASRRGTSSSWPRSDGRRRQRAAGVVVGPGRLTALVMLGRVYVGAHNPLDVTAGLGAGLLLGGLVASS